MKKTRRINKGGREEMKEIRNKNKEVNKKERK